MRGPQGMPQDLANSIEMACVLCSEAGSPGDIAEYIFANQPLAAKMAVHWHSASFVGAIGRLVQESLPGFDGVTYAVFAKAAAAIIEADIYKELANPLAKTCIAFVVDSDGQPPACEPLCVSALHLRIGTDDGDAAPQPEVIEAAELVESEIYKRLKGFLPKTGKQLPWWTTWKAVMEKGLEKEAKEKEAAAAEKRADKAVANQVAKEAREERESILADGFGGDIGDDDAPLVATSDAGATGGGGGSGAGATGEVAVTVSEDHVWAVSQEVFFKSKQGKEIPATVDTLQKNHCWVICGKTSCPESGSRKRVAKAKMWLRKPRALQVVQDPADLAETTPPGAAGPAVSGLSSTASATDVAAANAAAKKEKEKAAWSVLGNIFDEADFE